MMKSIRAKIFAASVLLLLFALLVQFIFIRGNFNRLYVDSIISSMETELDKTIEDYRPHSELCSYEPLSAYAEETGSPVLVFSEDYSITDNDLLHRMRMIEVALPDNRRVLVPLGYLQDIYGPNAPFLSRGQRIGLDLVSVNNLIYEPLSLNTANFSYTFRSNEKRYTSETVVSDYVQINNTWNMHSTLELQTERAELIYNKVKDCLMYQMNIRDYLDKLSEEVFSISGFDYRFFYRTRKINRINYYFVTAQRVIVTGFERSYIDRSFMVVYAALAVFIILFALILSKWISGPLKRISFTTQRIADLDFSDKIVYKSQDELGTLSDNINKMSDSLRTALSELRKSNEELSQASTLAKENEERMRRLLADLAHEFKTPLGLITGYLEALEMELDPSRTNEFYQIIENEVERLTDMVDETIDLTKLQSGYWKINRGNHLLTDIVSIGLHKFERYLEDNRFSLDMQVDDVFVFCDAHRIGQVISNFISNAIKYSDERKIISISSEISTSTVTISVGNSGSLDDAVIQSIWERDFSTGQSSTRLPSQGIGLAIVKMILDEHASICSVDQCEGMVYFRFTLPILVPEEDPS